MNFQYDKEIRFKKQSAVMLIAFLLLNYTLSFSGVAKYVFLLLLSGVLAFVAVVNRRELRARYFLLSLPLAVYIVVGVFAMIVRRSFQFSAVKMTLFMAVPLVAALCIRCVLDEAGFQRAINACFVSTVFLYAVIEKMADESQYGFVLGAYAIYYLSRKKWGYLFLACILEIFTGKRLAQISLVAFLLILLLFEKTSDRNKRALSRLSFLCFFVASYVYLYLCQNGLANRVMSQYGIVVSGREMGWAFFIHDYQISPLYAGKGIGWVMHKLENLNIRQFLNLHNDLMQAYIELGFWGYAFWLFGYAAVFTLKGSGYQKNRLVASVLLLYTFVNYATDNIMIYVNYWLPLYLLLIQLMDGAERKFHS